MIPTLRYGFRDPEAVRKPTAPGFIGLADYGQWVYDEESEKYVQWVMGESTANVFKPLIDQNTGEPLNLPMLSF